MSTDAWTGRRPDHPVKDWFVKRWSPRAFDDSALSLQELHVMLEAARWAPSGFNAQPWRFVFQLRGDPVWSRWVACINPNNRVWAQNAAALVLVASFTQHQRSGSTMPERNPHHAFDAGAAWSQMALQASCMGWYTHPMGGFDAAALSAEVGLPEHHVTHALVAIGRRGSPEMLPETLQARERPSARHPLSHFVWQGHFGSI